MIFRTKVRLGDLNLNDSIDDGATPIDVPVGEVIVHPKFRAKPLTNDIALIRLNHSVTFTGKRTDVAYTFPAKTFLIVSACVSVAIHGLTEFLVIGVCTFRTYTRNMRCKWTR